MQHVSSKLHVLLAKKVSILVGITGGANVKYESCDIHLKGTWESLSRLFRLSNISSSRVTHGWIRLMQTDNPSRAALSLMLRSLACDLRGMLKFISLDRCVNLYACALAISSLWGIWFHAATPLSAHSPAPAAAAAASSSVASVMTAATRRRRRRRRSSLRTAAAAAEDG